MRCVVLNCSLKSGGITSNTQLLAGTVIAAVPPGVVTELGDGDQWSRVHESLLDAEILIVATPTWVGPALVTRPALLEHGPRSRPELLRDRPGTRVLPEDRPRHGRQPRRRGRGARGRPGGAAVMTCTKTPTARHEGDVR
jgi:hypothetical protein